MNLIHHHGLELPVFGPEDGAFLAKEYEFDAVHRYPEDNSTFVRRAHLIIPASMTLQASLAYMQNEFDAWAEETSYRVVWHEYGLYPCDVHMRALFGSNDERIPAGYMLAAKTAIINRDDKIKHKIKEINAFVDSRFSEDLHTDINNVSQFTVGTSRVEQEGLEGHSYWITDLDVVLWRQRRNRLTEVRGVKQRTSAFIRNLIR